MVTRASAADPGEPRASGLSRRGQHRRDALVAAGVELLGESGWASITTRAVAERSGSNPGLVHYYWGGLPGLKADVARRAVDEAFEPVLEVLTSSGTWPAGLAAVIRAGSHQGRGAARDGAELVAASLRDPGVAALMADALSEARARVSTWLSETGVDEPEGTATLVLAVLDGLLLHRIIDPGLPLDAAAAASARLDPTR